MKRSLSKQTKAIVNKTVIRVSLLFILLGGGSIAFCQNNFLTPVIQPVPTSAVFLRYGNDQPSLQTGTVNIPISLVNVQAKDLNLPISLIYQTSGINVSDVPYPAGYGWTFSPGFRITRVILGRPDDRFRFRQSHAGESYDTLRPGIVDEGIANLHQLDDSDLFDTQKDIFTLHMPEGSFNFFIKKAGTSYQIISIGHQIRIEPEAVTGGGLTGFIVTDNNGIIYQFGYDNTSSFEDYTEPSSVGGFTAWMLRKITLVNNDTINFSWQKVNTNGYAPRVNTPIVIKDRRDADCPANSPPPYIEDPGGIIDYGSSGSSNSLMLKKIEYPDGVIDLTYKSSQDPFLQTITLKNKDNYIVKNIHLFYGDSNVNASNCLLDSLAINDEKYRFQYDGNYFYRQTTALDYWGFYNGKTTNYTLIPRMKLKIFTGINFPFSAIYEEIGYADRSVSAEHMKAFMLTRINFPTGGYSDYEYEPHQFPGQAAHTTGQLFYLDPDSIRAGGGLRVSKIKTYSSGTSTPIIKTFKYGANEDGLANSPIVPTLETFIDEVGCAYQEASSANCTAMGTNWRSYRQMTINALSNYSKFIINKNPIWYSKVTEYVNNEQKTEYNFSFSETYSVSREVSLYAVKSAYAFRYDNLFNTGPKLDSSINFKKTGASYTPVQRTINEYALFQKSGENISNVIIDRKGLFFHQSLTGVDLYAPSGNYPSGIYPTCNSFGFPGDFDYQKFPYTIAVQFYGLYKTLTTLYDNGQSITTNENLVYNEYRQLIKREKGKSITGQELLVKYKYSNDFTDTISEQMTARNMLAQVIEEKQYKSVWGTEILLSTIQTAYKRSGNLIVKDKIKTAKGASTPEIRVLFSQYDANGNLLEQQKAGDVKQSYIWDYNNAYPIAEVMNADVTSVAYTSFEAGGKGGWTFSGATTSEATAPTGKKAYVLSGGNITKSGLNSSVTYILSYWTNSSSAFSITGTITGYPIQGRVLHGWKHFEHRITGQTSITISGSNKIDELRFYPSNALITTYVYTPLVGMTSQCDANNRITYYEYDNVNRLSLIRDQDKNIMKKFCYNYAGQLEDCGIIYYSLEKSDDFTKNDCGPGMTGSPVTYTVPQGAYTSAVSPAAANQLAQNDLAANGQNYANSHGYCSNPDITLDYVNNTDEEQYIMLTNVSTSEFFSFYASANSSGNLGYVPPGNYDITIWSPGYNFYNYQAGCSNYTAGYGGSLYNVSLSVSCHYITISPNW